nr:hypothetical protein [Tanacetum cinerariifolium]
MDVRRIKEEVDLDFLLAAHNRTGPVESGDTCKSKVKPNRMRELVIKYKAEKVCHKEMVKMPLVDLTVIEARLNVDEAVARHGMHVSSITDRDGTYIEVLERDVEVVRNTSRFRILTFREAEIGESKMIGLELEQDTTKVVVIKERLKEAKDC